MVNTLSNQVAQRGFGKTSVALGTLTALGERLFGESKTLREIAAPKVVQEEQWVPSLCYQCSKGPDMIRVQRANGIATKVEYNPAFKDFDPNTICLKPLSLIQKLYNPYRIKNPLKRTNPEKSLLNDPGWMEISWDEALNIVAEKLMEIRRKGVVNPQGLPRVATTQGIGHNGYDGTWDAFWSAWGPTDHRSFSGGGGNGCAHSEHVFGELWHASFVCGGDPRQTKFELSMGRNTNATGGALCIPHHAEARVKGTKFVQVETQLSVTGATADEWIPIRPKTDAAFLFAMMHVILHEKDWKVVCDVEFLKKMTSSPYLVGPNGYFARDPETQKPLVWDTGDQAAKVFDDPTIKDFALEGSFTLDGIEVGADNESYNINKGTPSFQLLINHVSKYTPEWASPITDVPAATIRRIAEEFIDSAAVQAKQTMEVEGVTFPYRPVNILYGKSVNNGWGGYQVIWAAHMLVTLVGAMETPGGHCRSWTQFRSSTLVQRTSDGLPDVPYIFPTDKEKWVWPPTTRDGRAALTPISYYMGPGHLPFKFMIDPPENWPVSEPPDAWVTFRCNPVNNQWDKNTLYEAIKKIPFYVDFAYTLNETNQLHIILPDHNDLEGLQLYKHGKGREWTAFHLRQPIVEPLYNTMDMTDIFTELAQKMGILKEYNTAINQGALDTMLKLEGPLSLGPSRKYSREEIWDRQCQAASGDTRGLDWFKENGGIIKPGSKVNYFYTYHHMKAKGIRYELPYQERLKRIGTQLGRRLHESGIHWWDEQAEYLADPLTRWHDFPKIFDTGTDYDLWLTTCRLHEASFGSNLGVPLIIEAAKQKYTDGGVVMNVKAAQDRGIQKGDKVWIESAIGRVKAKAILVEGIHPEVILIASQFGHWKTPVAKEEVDWPNMRAITPISIALTDETGCGSDHVKVKMYKV
ncbi:MAG: molybdopterin-dependent oxidoreductase [Desulfobacterales bacterium]|nr:molybdopterin-dependent oxidoreductase [Desulfobacterales bacterium]